MSGTHVPTADGRENAEHPSYQSSLRHRASRVGVDASKFETDAKLEEAVVAAEGEQGITHSEPTKPEAEGEAPETGKASGVQNSKDL